MKCVEERGRRNEFQKDKERCHEEKKEIGGINLKKEKERGSWNYNFKNVKEIRIFFLVIFYRYSSCFDSKTKQ